MRFLSRWWWVLAGFVAAGASAADNVATVTILDGQASVIRDANRLRLAEGVRLNDGDLVRTGSDGFAQLEFADGVRLGVGPGSQLQIGPHLAKERQARPERIYLMSGWVKVSMPDGIKAVPAFSGVEADVTPGGSSVTFAGADAVQVFVETGTLKLVDRRTSAAVSLKAGDFYARKGAAKGAVTSRPPAEFLSRLPRPYRDSLPARIDRFRDRPVTPAVQGPIAYEDVAAWLEGENAIRQQFLARWRGLAADKAFRAGLVASLKTHPEWDRVLFPEKYLPKPKPKPEAPPPPEQASGPRRPASPAFLTPVPAGAPLISGSAGAAPADRPAR